MPSTLQSFPTPITLPGGLILRRSSPADAEKLATFNAWIHSDTDEPDTRVAAWTRDLLHGDHPTFAPDDFTIVEDPQTGKIVSSMNLISQTWSYAGIPFKAGRPELVGTDPEYRKRGLVRAQFDVIHAWSRQRGELVQGITGIPYYYRQFGYEMAANLERGRVGTLANVPKLAEGQPEPFLVRPAVESDLPLIIRLYRQGCRRSLLAAEWDERMWRYNLSGMSPDNVNRPEIRIIARPSGKAVGYLCHPIMSWGELMALNAYELIPGVSWYEVTPSVIRYLWQTGEEYARRENKTLMSFGFWLIENHPAYQVAAERLPRIRRRYAWYLRVPNLLAFLRHIAPALEQRLAGSPITGFTGEVKLGFYRSGINLRFKHGKLAQVENWQPSTKDYGKATYPGLTFLQLLFGYRSLDELEASFPDSFCDEELKPVLRVLFPRQPSDIWQVN